jgi:sugar phosphate isomerase/epimerase
VSSDNRLGIEFISVLAMPPVQFVELAAKLGAPNIGIALSPFSANPCGYPSWSLRDDPALRRDLVSAMADNGVKPWLGEGIFIRSGSDIRDAAADMDLLCDIGVTRINTVSIEPDASRGIDQLGIFTQMVAERGMAAMLEYMPGLLISSLASALDAVAKVGSSNLRLMLDCMHFFRTGSSAAELTGIDQDLIGHVQLCDVPNKPIDQSYGEEALHNRLLPGDGDIPLAEIFGALPRTVTVGLELPMRDRAEAGETPDIYLAEGVRRSQALLNP